MYIFLLFLGFVPSCRESIFWDRLVGRGNGEGGCELWVLSTP